MNRFFLLALGLVFHSLLLSAQEKANTDVLVIGGSAGGTAAGIQSARSGVKTLIVEQTPWLGGMLTAAGVSCTDGNDELWSGLWMEFREALYKHYQTRNLFSGWVSETCFEPHVGDSLLKAMAAREKQLSVRYGWYFDHVVMRGDQVTGASFMNARGEELLVKAKVTIDASDLGDAFASAGAKYDLGMEDAAYSGESMAPGTNQIIQDLTWAAVLQDYGKPVPHLVRRPEHYDSTRYFCCCNEAPCKGKPWNGDARKMLDYGKLTLSPGQTQAKYMINWPNNGNDYTINVVEQKPLDREKALLPAREKTLGFIYFIQTQLGYNHLGLAGEFPTEDRLPFMPYYREGRRLRGVVRFNVNHVVQPFGQCDALYRTGISVGDYPVDHHHAPEKKAPGIDFPKVPSFNIPMGALIPESVNGLVVCEKGISVSNIVNGSTRLQPCVLLTGQAAGLIAAQSVAYNKQPREIGIRDVQDQLIRAKAYVMPYIDIRPDDPDWASVQRIGATGILKGTGVPEGWANKTFFYPDSSISCADLLSGLEEVYGPIPSSLKGSGLPVTMKALLDITTQLGVGVAPAASAVTVTDGPSLTRKQVAVFLDRKLNPFRLQVDWNGRFIH